jgi:hypothetical protein
MHFYLFFLSQYYVGSDGALSSAYNGLCFVGWPAADLFLAIHFIQNLMLNSNQKSDILQNIKKKLKNTKNSVKLECKIRIFGDEYRFFLFHQNRNGTQRLFNVL